MEEAAPGLAGASQIEADNSKEPAGLATAEPMGEVAPGLAVAIQIGADNAKEPTGSATVEPMGEVAPRAAKAEPKGKAAAVGQRDQLAAGIYCCGDGPHWAVLWVVMLTSPV